MDGSEKIIHLVIGKSAKPRCFKGINSFPTKYCSNKKAWMTTELYNEWLVSLNLDMKREKRYILLFLDNCTVHNNALPLSNVKLQFFPPNSTAKLQPLEQGIIHTFKTFCRREVVKSVLDNIENQQNVTTISILAALIMIDKALRADTRMTIHSCFKKSGFPSPNLVDEDYTLNGFNAEPSLWEALPEQELTFDDYVMVETDIAVWGALSDAEIGALDHNNTESDEDESELTPVTLSEVKVSLNKLRNFFLQNHVDADILLASLVLENTIDKFGLAIHQNDHQARRRFVEWTQNEIAVDPDFHKRILFSDKAHFWLNGYVNKQNCRIWSEANPQEYVETPLHPGNLTVWCALWAGGILLQKR
ncbi:tigger transposable element-derived protein 6 [Trichonephila clavipes]|nr:tigger transposable element-derived protein 6 [Trichonephila clavipes]